MIQSFICCDFTDIFLCGLQLLHLIILRRFQYKPFPTHEKSAKDETLKHLILGRNTKTISIFNPFPDTTILQQTTLNKFYQKIENLYNWMDNLWHKAENIVSKGEIACFEQFLLVFKKPSAAEASESVYFRERVIFNYCIDLKTLMKIEITHYVDIIHNLSTIQIFSHKLLVWF